MAAHRQIIDALWQRDGALARAGIARDIGDAADNLSERLRTQYADAPRQAIR
jgi:DNA-binding GntR family transcriptional regulator